MPRAMFLLVRRKPCAACQASTRWDSTLQDARSLCSARPYGSHATARLTSCVAAAASEEAAAELEVRVRNRFGAGLIGARRAAAQAARWLLPMLGLRGGAVVELIGRLPCSYVAVVNAVTTSNLCIHGRKPFGLLHSNFLALLDVPLAQCLLHTYMATYTKCTYGNRRCQSKMSYASACR